MRPLAHDALTSAAGQPQVIPVAGRLRSVGAHRGAATVLFNAAIQRQAAENANLTEWTPQGRIPLRARKAAEQLHPTNDNHDDPSKNAPTIA